MRVMFARLSHVPGLLRRVFACQCLCSCVVRASLACCQFSYCDSSAAQMSACALKLPPCCPPYRVWLFAAGVRRQQRQPQLYLSTCPASDSPSGTIAGPVFGACLVHRPFACNFRLFPAGHAAGRCRADFPAPRAAFGVFFSMKERGPGGKGSWVV